MKRMTLLLIAIITLNSCTKEETVTRMISQFEITFEQNQEFIVFNDDFIAPNYDKRNNKPLNDFLSVDFQEDRIVFITNDHEIALIQWDAFDINERFDGSKTAVIRFDGLREILANPNQRYIFKVGFVGDLSGEIN